MIKFGIPFRHPSIRTLKETKSSKRKWYEEISGRYWSDIIRGAKYRNLDFNISMQYAWNLFIKQNKKCALSGVEIEFYKCGNKRNKQTASLDRIDSKSGYIIDNVQWVHKTIQRIKMDMLDKDLICWAHKISETHL